MPIFEFHAEFGIGGGIIIRDLMSFLLTCDKLGAAENNYYFLLLSGQGGCQDDDYSVYNIGGGPPTCAILAADRFQADGTDQCAKDHILGQYCKKSCGTCQGWLHITQYLEKNL